MLSADSITVTRGASTLLDDVSVSLACGEVLAVIGPNGAGKSTLLKVMAGDLPADAGQVCFDNVPINQIDILRLAQLRAVLPQDSNTSFPFRANEIIEMGRSPHVAEHNPQKDQNIVAHVAELTGITDMLNREITTLSGGERQRTHFARVLAQIWEPEATLARYLLLDEPTSALDIAHQHHILSIARRLAAEQKIGVLAVVHDLNLAATYADRVALLSEGQLQCLGSPDEVFSSDVCSEAFGIVINRIDVPGYNSPILVTQPNAQAPA
ncbi:MAG: heme ABC transporter ATP-binding protein [Pseudomonadota bacterium]